MSNQPKNSQKGFAANFTASVDKSWADGFSFNAFYTYGTAFVTNEPTSSQNNSQWQFMETVNGRNFVNRSRSDFDLGHRFSMFAAKKFTYFKGNMATTVSVVYNGQSGSAFSYVYGNAPIRDNSATETGDLLFIPTKDQLTAMTFVTQTGFSLSPDAQKAAFEAYINQDSYLSKRRGQYAERTAIALPFLHRFDFSVAQDVFVKIKGKRNAFQIRADILNFGNMLNKNWGVSQRAGAPQLLNLVSRHPVTNEPYYRLSTQRDATNTFLARDTYQYNSSVFDVWTAQLGIRYTFGR
jgi:hypothetical protein